MKKILVGFFANLLVFGIVGIAGAVPTTWTDSIDFDPDITIPPAFSYYHDISDNGFESAWMNPGVGDDTITSYDLTISIYDDNLPTYIQTFWGTITIPDYGEVATIWTVGGIYSYDFSLTSETYTGNIWGILDIYDDGTLNVLITDGWGDFCLASSELTAYGDDGTASVPEPATMLLLGFGLVGIAGFRKRFMKK